MNLDEDTLARAADVLGVDPADLRAGILGIFEGNTMETKTHTTHKPQAPARCHHHHHQVKPGHKFRRFDPKGSEFEAEALRVIAQARRNMGAVA